MKDYAQQTLHLSSVTSEKISNLDNEISFCERKRDFCRKLSDNALLAREYAYMEWEKADKNTRRSESRLKWVKAKCRLYRFFLVLRSKL